MAKKKQKVTKGKKTLKDLKRSKDVHFRKRAEREESLLPATDLSSEIRMKKKSLKGTKREIQEQQEKVKKFEADNRKINQKRKDLENEYAFADEERKKEIDRLLNSPDYRKKDISRERNFLKALQGKPFDFIVDDGFKVYKISSKELDKYWKKGKDASLPILKNMEKNTKKTINYYKKLIEKEKGTATKARLKKLNRIKDALEKKLSHTIKQNIAAIEEDDMSELDEYDEFGNKGYSMLFRVVGFKIDRIGI